MVDAGAGVAVGVMRANGFEAVTAVSSARMGSSLIIVSCMIGKAV